MKVRGTFKVLPGIPGMAGVRDGDRIPYPDSTIDFVKVAREHGLEPTFLDTPDERSFAGHKAAEQWLPILEWSSTLLTGVGGGLMVELLKDYLGMDGSSDADVLQDQTLHVDWRVTRPDGSEERFVADGASSEVLEALNEFERRNTDD